MRIKERVAAIFANMNRTDSNSNLLTLVPVQEAKRFVWRHGVGPLWPEQDSNNRFIYPLRINLEQILLNADDQDVLNKDYNNHSKCELNKGITVVCCSS